MIKLEVLNTAFKGKRFRVKDGLTVGSGPEATIRAQHKDLQDIHVRFGAEQGRAVVQSANEQAHLYVNGKDVLRHVLRHGDELVVGPLKFKVLDMTMVSSASIRLDELMEQLETTDEDDIYDFAREDLFYLTTKDPTLRERISFVIPSKDRFIDQAQVFLARLVKQSSTDEEQVDAFMTCAKELILNAHRHGHKYDESKRIVLRFRNQADRLTLSIQDEGPGFDHRALLNSVPTKDAATAARERYLAGGFGGLGFQLIMKLTKDLSYNDEGNKVTFSVLKTAEG